MSFFDNLNSRFRAALCGGSPEQHDALVDTATEYYAKPRDLIVMLICSLVISSARRVYEQHVAPSLARLLDIRDTRKRPDDVERLEQSYAESSTPGDESIQGLCKQLDLSEKYVRAWFRKRRNVDRPSVVKRFTETSYRFFFYTFVFAFGMGTIARTPWFWDTRQCWIGYPFQPLLPSVYYYYMIEGGFYISLLFSLVGDIKRKDFVEQVVHHVATIGLIAFSYFANFVRIGTLVMAVHDVSDVLLEGAKCVHYADWKRAADKLFVVFAATFMASRLYVYPRVILNSTLFEILEVLEFFPGLYIFNGLLITLQVLHIFWASIIVRMAIRMQRHGGKVEKDARSDVDETDDDDDDGGGDDDDDDM